MKYELTFELDRVKCDPPKNWMDLKFESSFGNDIQPELSVDEFIFVNREAQQILTFIENLGPFQGMLFTITITSLGVSRTWNCILDLSDGLTVISPIEVSVKIKPDEGLDLIDSNLKAISYGYLAGFDKGERGFIDNEHYVDVPVVIRKKFDATETAMASISIFIITQQVAEFSKTFTQKKIDGIVTALSAPLQKPAEFFRMLAYTILILAYYAAMLIAVIRLIKTLIDNIVPKPTNYKGLRLRTALERALDYYHIELESNIPELDYYVYLPSKTDNKIRKNRKDEGIPNTSDYGYQVSEMFELVLKLFRAKPIMQVNNGRKKLIIRSEKNLTSLSSYVLPDVLTEQYTLNTNDMKANFILSFLYDPTDEYTMPNARDTPFDSKKKDEEKNRYEKGVSYEVITRVKNRIQPDPQFDLLKNLEEVRIPLALGTRRNTLSVLEQSVKALVSLIDLVIKLFGGKTFAEKINEGKGRLLISHNSFNTAKLVVLQNGLIPQNHRDLLSARALYNNYHFWRSFKSNPNFTQAKVFENIRIPFSFQDFIKTNQSSFFKTIEGKEGQFINLSWKVSDDYAVATYKVFEKFTDNLEETTIEP